MNTDYLERDTTYEEAKKSTTGAIVSINERIARFNCLANKIIDRYQPEDRVIPLSKLIDKIRKEFPDIVSKLVDLTNNEFNLIYLVRRLEMELSNSIEEAMLFKQTPEITTVKKTELFYFGMPDSEAMMQHWVEVYSRLLKKGWLRSNETESGDWVYLCCGKGIAPTNPIVWHGTNAALAYIVRTYLGGNWDVAQNVFVTKNGNPLPKSFSKTKPPTDSVCKVIDLMFKKH